MVSESILCDRKPPAVTVGPMRFAEISRMLWYRDSFDLSNNIAAVDHERCDPI
jgi:hypothetical protein